MGYYDFAGAARDSRDGGDAADASPGGLGFTPGLAFSDSQRGQPNNLGVPDGWAPPPAGLAGLDSSGRGIGGSSSTGGTQVQPPLGVAGVNAFAEGGAIPDGEEESPMMNTMGSRMQVDINAALKTVGDVFSYGRRLHGLEGGGEKQAGNMPTKPFSETPKPQPMMPPSALPYGPNEKPFGKRGAIDDGSMEVAGNIPTKPFNETPRPQPMMPPSALPYGPGEKPFGKRVSENDAPTSDEPDEGGAIDTDDEETA